MTKHELLIDELFSSMQQMQRAWKSHFYKVMADEHFSPTQMVILFFIKEKQPISGSDLAVEMQISRSAITQLLDGLDQHGFIEREADPKDRRISYIRLSKLGEDQVEQIAERRKSFIVSAADSLDDTELKSMITIQNKMVAQIEKQANTK